MDTIINFICDWPEDRTKAWSGSMYYLFEALKKDQRVTINDVNIHDLVIKYKYIYKIRKYSPSIFNLLYKFIILKKIKKRLKGNIVLSMYTDYFGKNYKHFTYQDLSYPYLYNLFKNLDKGFEYSGFQQRPINLKKNAEIQYKYYSKNDGTFTMSKNLYISFLEDKRILDKDKIHFVGSGVNSVIEPYSGGEKEESFVFIGKDFIRKSGDLVCEAYKLIKNQLHINSKLYIIGPKFIDEKYLAEGIVFMGEQPYSECARMMKKCKVFVMPSRFEAYGLVFPEALINGCICIGNNAYEMKNFINESNGYLVDIKDDSQDTIKTLSLAMLKAINSDLVINGDDYVSEYSWDNVAKKMIDEMLK